MNKTASQTNCCQCRFTPAPERRTILRQSSLDLGIVQLRRRPQENREVRCSRAQARCAKLIRRPFKPARLQRDGLASQEDAIMNPRRGSQSFYRIERVILIGEKRKESCQFG